MRFWSDPDTELKLAKNTGATVFRMGVDWSRIMPQEPVNGLKESVSQSLTFPIDDELWSYLWLGLCSKIERMITFFNFPSCTSNFTNQYN